MVKNRAVFHWSGGKDSSLALHRILGNPQYSIGLLLTAINSRYDRVTMHGVRRELVELQAKSIGIRLEILSLPDSPSMDVYNSKMRSLMTSFKEKGYSHSVFGDIFLQDLRSYREEQQKKSGFLSTFPIWGENTSDLMDRFISDGFKAITVCVDGKKLGKQFIGRHIDHEFIHDLPDDVDPCGENGEFHTFVYDGPIFKKPIPLKKGEVVYRKYNSPENENRQDSDPMGFWFCDLLPV